MKILDKIKLFFLLIAFVSKECYDIKYVIDLEDLKQNIVHVDVEVKSSYLRYMDIPKKGFELYDFQYNNNPSYSNDYIYMPSGSHCRYSVRQTGVYSLNFLEGSLLHAMGNSFLITPYYNYKYKVLIEWKNADDINFVYHTDDNFKVITDSIRLKDSYFIAGDFDYEYSGDIMLSVSHHHKGQFAEVRENCLRMMQMQEDFFSKEDSLNETFMISIVNANLKRNDKILGYYKYRYFIGMYNLDTISHEFVHRYINSSLNYKNMPKWFTEGFTEFISLSLLVEHDMISKEDFIKRVNSYIYNVYTEKYKYRYDYDYGFVFCMHLNHLLKERNHSFRTFINRLLDLQDGADFSSRLKSVCKEFGISMNVIQKEIKNIRKLKLPLYHQDGMYFIDFNDLEDLSKFRIMVA